MPYPKEQRLENLTKKPLMDAIDYCASCSDLQKFSEKYKEDKNSLTQDELAAGRYKCVHCKNKNYGYGIYKFDAILTLGYNNKKWHGNLKGKQPTAEKRFGHAVRNLRKEGYSIRDIANILHMSPTTVQDILKKKL